MSYNAAAKPTIASKKVALDAWNDDWEALADSGSLDTGVKLESAESTPSTKTSKQPSLLAQNPAGSKKSSAVDDLAPHVQNLQLWNQANSTTAFEVVSSTPQSTKINYKPELKILKRSTSNTPSSQAGTPKPVNDNGEKDPEETSAEKMERLRKERELKYTLARERLFGPEDKSASAGTDFPTSGSVDRPQVKSGKNSGTSTPNVAGKSGTPNVANDSGKATPNRKSSPATKQRRRKDIVDDDFVPRSAMVAGTYESYQMDQQLQAGVGNGAGGMQQPYGIYPQYAGAPNSLPVNDPYASYQQNPSMTKSTGLGYGPRPMQSQSPWDNQNQQPQAFHQQYPSHPYAPQQQPQQTQPSQQYQPPYMTYQSSVPTSQQYQQPQSQQQSLQQQQQLYDPLYPSSNVPPHLQYQQHNQSLQQHQQQLIQPIRTPRGPDSSGRGGFGFANRGGSVSGIKPNMARQAYQSNELISSGFNSAAAAAPWGATAVNGSLQPSQNQIWSGQSGTNSRPPSYNNGHGGYHQNNSLGGGGIWGGGSGTWGKGDA